MSRPVLVWRPTTESPATPGFASLEASLLTADRLSQQIAGSLTRLGGASTAIESAIKPISGSTQTYSNISKRKNFLVFFFRYVIRNYALRLKLDVDATVEELEVLRSYQSVFEEEEPRIRRGNLTVVECLQSIDRLNKTIKALEGSVLKSDQQVIVKMSQLKIAAVANIRERFTKLLASASNSDGDSFDPLIADETVENLSTMVDFFMVTDNSVAVPVYSEIRSKYIGSHLTKLSAAAARTDIKRVNGFYKKGSTPFKEFVESLAITIVVCIFLKR